MEEEVLTEEPMGDKMDVQKPRVNKREQSRIKEGNCIRIAWFSGSDLIFFLCTGLSYKDQLMMPEFLSEIPPDFTEKWIAMPFPQGTYES